MKIIKRILTILIVLILLALGGGMVYLYQLKNRSVPDYNASVDLENLAEPVTVIRDSMGIPHIYAKNEADLYRTVGYVMAQDRMWQMDLIRRITLGRLSEVLDPGLVDADQLFRSLRFSEKSRKVMEQTPPGVLAAVEAYSDGVNQYLTDYRKKLPFEFAMLGYKPDPWEPVHTFNLVGYMHWDLASGWTEEIALYKLQQILDSALFRELVPDMDYLETVVYPDSPGAGTAQQPQAGAAQHPQTGTAQHPQAGTAHYTAAGMAQYTAAGTAQHTAAGRAPELQSHMEDAIRVAEELGLQLFRGSNNWAVSGSRSETGMPLMANDMHLGLMSPGIWYQMHQVVEGEFNVTGVGFPCSPFIVAGHNEQIAWGWTNLYVDDTDFYLETLHPSDSTLYKLDGEWVEMERVEERIPVKGRDEPEIRINRFTHRGPVVSSFKDVPDRVISMRWQGMSYSDEYRTVHLLPRATNWEEFRDAVSTFYVGQNCVYADREGNIGMQAVGGVPVRKGSGISVYPGDTTLYDWSGLVPFEELPHTFNPENGTVSSANNRTIGEDYPHYIGNWFAMPHRIDRIREMLDAREKHDMDSFREMLRDHVSHHAGEMTPLIVGAMEGSAEGIYAAALEELTDWDFHMGAGSPAALIFDLTWIELHRVLFADELGNQADLLINSGSLVWHLMNRIRTEEGSAWCDDVTTSGVRETYPDNLRSAFTRAVDTISARFGEDPSIWKWGDLHKVALMHPMGSVEVVDRIFRVNSPLYPIGGSFHTVCPYSYPLGSSFTATAGASERIIYNTADWDRSLTVIPTGTSGVPASPHYLDQTELYVNNGYHPDPFTREAVEAYSLYRAQFE